MHFLYINPNLIQRERERERERERDTHCPNFHLVRNEYCESLEIQNVDSTCIKMYITKGIKVIQYLLRHSNYM